MDKHITSKFTDKAKSKGREAAPHPSIVGIVKLLARISAEKDYNSHITKINKHGKKGIKDP
jgi:hypothetical protein